MSTQINASHNTFELSGEFTITSIANENLSLEEVNKAIEKSFEDFATEEIKKITLDRLKVTYEISVYNGLTSILNKAQKLAWDNEFYDNPSATQEHIKKYQDITAQDLKQVFNLYIKDKNNVTTSFVPLGKRELALVNASEIIIEQYNPVEDSIIEQKDDPDTLQSKTPSFFDRTIEPAYGDKKSFKMPEINSDTLDNGLTLLSIEQNELPIINFSVHLKGGLLLDNLDKIGVANLYGKLLVEGSKNNTPEQLKQSLGLLGSTIYPYVSKNGITLFGSCLSKNFEETIKIVQQMILEPRFDEVAFKRIKSNIESQIIASNSNNYQIIDKIANQYRFGPENILSKTITGTKESLALITIEDLKKFHSNYSSPSITSIQVVGDVSTKKVKTILTETFSEWTKIDVNLPKVEYAPLPDEPTIILVDVPKSKQTFVSSNRAMMNNLSEDYYTLEIANYKLGIFPQGKLWDILREEKGYTYRAYTNIYRDVKKSTWSGIALLQTEVTKDGLYLFHKIISEYPNEYNQELLNATKNEMQKRLARDYESPTSLLTLLLGISSKD